ncbi:hypothetical protein HDU83_007519 [Entophlyctis luteolus]|nr:hypothetical protein HDU83_007519 [Entophlyctis luteolus]
MSYQAAGAAVASVTTPATVGMAASNRIRASLASGKASVGAWIMLPGTTVARTMATLGFDVLIALPWILIDGEHGNMQDSDWHDSVNAVAVWGPSPIIRIPQGEEFIIKRALDTGAHGIMVPMCNTVEYAKEIVQRSKFPPMGRRGHGGPFPATAWKTTMDDYNKNANANTFIIVQIETKQAVENADAIAAVEGIDMLFVGPNDLAASYGLPPTSEDYSPIMEEAMEKIRSAAKRHGKFVGIWASDGPMAARRIEQGFQMVSVGADVMAIGAGKLSGKAYLSARKLANQDATASKIEKAEKFHIQRGKDDLHLVQAWVEAREHLIVASERPIGRVGTTGREPCLAAGHLAQLVHRVAYGGDAAKRFHPVLAPSAPKPHAPLAAPPSAPAPLTAQPMRRTRQLPQQAVERGARERSRDDTTLITAPPDYTIFSIQNPVLSLTGFTPLRNGPPQRPDRTGEYTTGFVGGAASNSDKSFGVVGLVMFDLRSRGKINKISMVGTTGLKNEGIRAHLQNGIGKKYKGLDTTVDLMPADGVERDPEAYKAAIDKLSPGDAVIVFTPDDTHFPIALYAIEHGCHVMVAKPAVKTVDQHRQIVNAAERKGVLAVVELHKRYDPIYADAREKIRTFGDFSHYNAYMSQPKQQLKTFKSWAGKSSDISYYLNSHHIDMLTWSQQGRAVPISVVASAATGVATSEEYGCVSGTEDTITVMVTFKNIASGSRGTALFTSSWIAPKAEVHSQQRFFYMGHNGEVRVDQAHRGYEAADDSRGFYQNNPLFLRYTPDPLGRYAGQSTYGHQSFEKWVDAVLAVNKGENTPGDFETSLPTFSSTLVVTQILEAGRQSLDSNGAKIDLV